MKKQPVKNPRENQGNVSKLRPLTAAQMQVVCGGFDGGGGGTDPEPQGISTSPT